MLIRFGLDVMCGNSDPARFVYRYRGEIFDFEESMENDELGIDEPNVKVGEVEVFYVDRARLMEEGGSLFEAMDDTSSDAMACYEAVINQDSGDWKDEVQEIIGEDFVFRDNLMLINRLQIEERFRGKGLGAEVAHEVIKTLGSYCAVIACKPFPLQYIGYDSPDKADERKAPGYEKKRRAAFRKVEAFWKKIGFEKLRASEHYILASR